MNEVFKFSPKILMNLLLNFESFDQTTKIRDVYMPEEKIINFNVGYLKLNFKGKLRLTQDRENEMKVNNPSIKSMESYPSGSYGVVEERDLFIKFDKPVIIKYLFIRPHFSNKDNRMMTQEMNLFTYKNEQVVYSTKMYMPRNTRDWTKIVPSHNVIDTIRIPKDFDVDDISISHDSDNSENTEDQGQLTSILQSVIDDLIDQNNNKNIKKEDDL